MKKFFPVLLLMLLGCFSAFAGNPLASVIIGKVVDAHTGQPVEFANVAVFNQSDNKLAGGGMTDAQGVFRLEGLKAGIYTIKASFIGYEPLEVKDVQVDGRQNKNIGVLKLGSSDTELEEVEVVAKTERVQYKIDKKIVNVAADANADGGSAADALEGVPSVEVDIEGNVSLRGSSNFTVLIDGKPTALDAADVLKQTPAAMIQNIEIITNASAKYDPEGETGIINLVTKKNVMQGVNGVVNLNCGSQGRYGADFLLNLRKKKINYFAGGNFNRRGREGEGINNLITYSDEYDKYVNQDNKNKNRFGGEGLKAGIDYYPNDKNSINFTLEGGIWGGNNEGSNQYDTWYRDKNSTADRDMDFRRSVTDDENQSVWGSFSTSWQHDFAQKGHKINLNAYYSRNQRDEDNDFMQYQADTKEALDASNSIAYGHQVANDKSQDRARVNFDYTKPFADDNGKIEAGYQGDLSHSFQDYDFDDYLTSNGTYEKNTDFTNDITFKRFINAVYGTVSRSFGGFGVQLGLRGEYTFRQLSSPKEADKHKYEINRFDLFPTLHLSQQVGERNSLQIGYSRRIRRPWEGALNPFPRYSDEYSRILGNPDLDPVYTNAFELNYQMNFDKMSWAFESFYRYTKGQMEMVSTLGENDILISQFQNLSNNNNMGFAINGQYDPTKWFGVNVDFEVRQYFINGVYNGESRKQDGRSWRTRETFNFNPTRDTKIQVTLRYNGANKSLISSNKGNFDAGLAVRQSLFKKKVSVTLGMRDIFNTRRMESTTETKEYYLYNKRHNTWPMWNAGLSIKLNNFKEKMPGGSYGEGDGSMGGGDDFGGDF